jgi:hypothetical protein
MMDPYTLYVHSSIPVMLAILSAVVRSYIRDATEEFQMQTACFIREFDG